jgi:hypothetical protein
MQILAIMLDQVEGVRIAVGAGSRRDKSWSSQQGCGSKEVKALRPSIAHSDG